jgi:hypothetical protein
MVRAFLCCPSIIYASVLPSQRRANSVVASRIQADYTFFLLLEAALDWGNQSSTVVVVVDMLLP